VPATAAEGVFKEDRFAAVIAVKYTHGLAVLD
jgi:hypothetical protein